LIHKIYRKINLAVFLALGTIIILIGMSHAMINGVLTPPYPWDDVDSIYHGYVNAYDILSSGNFVAFFSAITSDHYHAVGSVFATLGFLLSGQPAVAYLMVVFLTLVPIGGAMTILRSPWWAAASVFLVSPLFLAASTTFKTDLLGGIAFGAAALSLFTLATRHRTATSEYWILAVIGILALTAKMTSLINPLFYLAIFCLAVFIRLIYRIHQDEPETISWHHGICHAVPGYLVREKELFLYAFLIPFIVYIIFFVLQYRQLTDYIYSVLGPNSIWKDTLSFHSRIHSVYFPNTGTIPFLPAIGPLYASGTVSLSLLFAGVGCFRPSVYWRTITLFTIGALYVLAIARLSPVTNNTFAAPGYGLMHFAVLDFLQRSRPEMLQRALAAVIAGFFFFATHNAWQGNPFTGNGFEYGRLIDAVTDAVGSVENPVIVTTAEYSRIPPPNFSYELLRRRKVGRWVYTKRIDDPSQVNEALAGAAVLIVVRITNTKICSYIVTCKVSNSIADEIEAKIKRNSKSFGTYVFPDATLTVYSTRVEG
jgi:hypothetical protein